MYFWWIIFIIALFSVTYKPKNLFLWIFGGLFFISKLAYVLFSISASAREQELWIWKKVFNIFTKEPVLNAKVDLLSEDSTLIATSFSNAIINGKKCAAMFILKKPGKYIFHASQAP